MEKMSFKAWLCLLGGAFLLTGTGLWLLQEDLQEKGSQAAQLTEHLEQPAATTSVTMAPSPEPLQTNKLDINTASVQELASLPGIGNTLAERIVAYRKEKPFKVTRDIKKVAGIGDKKFEAISHLICVTAPT